MDKPSTDGTVRRAECGMNMRLIELVMTERGSVARRRNDALVDKPHLEAGDRVMAENWLNVDIPAHLVGDGTGDGLSHATILSDPPANLQALVLRAFRMIEAKGGQDPGTGV